MMAYAKDKPADHVMAFTRSDIRFNEAGSEIAGVALFAGACSDQRLSIVKDEGLHSWGVAAHELAHSLGADHDDNKPQCEKWRKFIQTPVLSDYSIGDVANSYRFSKCSVEEMKSFLSTKNATCLKSRQSTAKAVLTSNASEGARLTLDQVCRLAFPSTPGHFYLQTASLMTPAAICAKIHCSLTELALKPVTKSGLRAPVGTPCGNKRSCNWNGQCTADFAAPSAGSSFWGNQLVSSLCSDFLKYVLGLIPKFGTAKALTVCYKLVRYCGSKKFFRLVCVRLAKQILN
ncbi:hypothetical protein BOX15_Mlig030074g1 [Macrostomum lignano]|uniref:Peptidase M12B domain-containing protein n=1 Tax=Macrostomum lignano TaxID=282301 RepID=A0A267DIQ2_9PLAT|nr:hypothetical protein BOX15_Mlig030074g1 [Macrostomum lignano]